MEHFLTMKEAVQAYINGCQSKINSSPQKIMVKALFAGMMIGMGAAAGNMVSHAISNPGLAKLAAGIVFPVGLMMVILIGAELFTGDCLMIMGTAAGKNKALQVLKILVLVYIGNFIGSFLLAAAIAASGQWDTGNGLLGAYTIKVALGKTSLSFGKAMVSGILCNILVCAAVMMALCAKDIAGKLLSIFFTIMLFVTTGFEHCIANMYYISAGLIARFNPEYANMAMNTYGFSAEQFSNLTVYNFLIGNLLPVTIGNIIGGMLIIGLPLLYLYRSEEESLKVKEEKNEHSIIFGKNIADIRN